MNKIKLSKLLTIKNGKIYSHLKHGLIPLYGSGGLMSYVNDYVYDGESILLPRKGTLDNIQFVNGKFWTVDTIYYTEVNPNVNAYFLYNYLKLLNLSGLNSGSTLPSMTQSSYYDIVINLPEKHTQDKIAQLIFSINEKVKLNNKINTKLESMAKLIYDYWFMQFDFPDKNGKPYKSSGGKMVWSDELKLEVPDKWYVKSLSYLIEEAKNGDWGMANYAENLSKVFCIRGADINGLNGTESFEPPTRYIDKSHSNRLLKEDDLIIEISGGSPTQSTGRMSHISQKVLGRLNNSAVCSNFCKAISLKNTKLSFVISRYWARLYEANIFFNYEGKTSGIKNLLFNQLADDVKIAIPADEDLLNKYYEFEEILDKQKQNNLAQNKELSKLRDWLLPMLMNGQVKIEG